MSNTGHGGTRRYKVIQIKGLWRRLCRGKGRRRRKSCPISAAVSLSRGGGGAAGRRRPSPPWRGMSPWFGPSAGPGRWRDHVRARHPPRHRRRRRGAPERATWAAPRRSRDGAGREGSASSAGRCRAGGLHRLASPPASRAAGAPCVAGRRLLSRAPLFIEGPRHKVGLVAAVNSARRAPLFRRRLVASRARGCRPPASRTGGCRLRRPR